MLVKKQLISLIVLTTKTAQLVLIRDATPSLTWKGNLLFFNFPHPLLNLISTLLLQGTISFLILLSFISFFFFLVQFFSSYQATYHLGIVTNANIRCFLYAFYGYALVFDCWVHFRLHYLSIGISKCLLHFNKKRGCTGAKSSFLCGVWEKKVIGRRCLLSLK